MPRNEPELLIVAANLLGTHVGRISADALTTVLTANEEERIMLRRILPVLGWRRQGGAYWRHRRTPRLTIRDGSVAPFEPTSLSTTQAILFTAFGAMVGTVTNYDAWKATNSSEPYTAAAKRLVAQSMRNLGFERIRLRADGKVSITYVRGNCVKDRRRPIYVFRDVITKTITVTYERSTL